VKERTKQKIKRKKKSSNLPEQYRIQKYQRSFSQIFHQGTFRDEFVPTKCSLRMIKIVSKYQKLRQEKLRANMHKNLGYSLPLYLLYLCTLYKGMMVVKQHEGWLTKTCTGDSVVSQLTNQYPKEYAISA